MVYDTVLNITWLADFNYAKSSGFDADGFMDWTTANTWANTLAYGGVTGWRLPTALNANGSGPCAGFNCTGSEMGHLFYIDFGATAGSSVLVGSNTANLALFTNVQSFVYWSGTVFVSNPFDVWTFGNGGGAQGTASKSNSVFAVAVHAGDVAAAVPEPQTYAMFLAGLGALVVAVRRQPR